MSEVQAGERPPARIEDLQTGSILEGRYELVERLGAGGAGRVYRAHDRMLQRDVAVKLFYSDDVTADDAERRVSEAKVLASLSHASLVTLYDAQVQRLDHAFLAMELIDGPTLRRRIEDGPIADADVAALLRDLADALATVHRAGIVHRDVKPSNVLLRPSGRSAPSFRGVLADFGVAHLLDSGRLTSPGMVVGTAAYLAPEQVRGGEPTPASDVYALGLMIIEALTRLHPFGTHSAPATLVARLQGPPEMPADLDHGWDALLRGMTDADPAQRPSAEQVSLIAASLSPVVRISRTAEPAETVETEKPPSAVVDPFATVPLPLVGLSSLPTAARERAEPSAVAAVTPVPAPDHQAAPALPSEPPARRVDASAVSSRTMLSLTALVQTDAVTPVPATRAASLTPGASVIGGRGLRRPGARAGRRGWAPAGIAASLALAAVLAVALSIGPTAGLAPAVPVTDAPAPVAPAADDDTGTDALTGLTGTEETDTDAPDTPPPVANAPGATQPGATEGATDDAVAAEDVIAPGESVVPASTRGQSHAAKQPTPSQRPDTAQGTPARDKNQTRDTNANAGTAGTNDGTNDGTVTHGKRDKTGSSETSAAGDAP